VPTLILRRCGPQCGVRCVRRKPTPHWGAWGQAGGRTILELWVPAGELDEFNANLVGLIEVVHEFPVSGYPARARRPGEVFPARRCGPPPRFAP